MANRIKTAKEQKAPWGVFGEITLQKVKQTKAPQQKTVMARLLLGPGTRRSTSECKIMLPIHLS